MSVPLPPVPRSLITYRDTLRPEWQSWFAQLYTYLTATAAGGGGIVSANRKISTTPPLTGGGTLANDLTLAVSVFTSGASGVVPASGGGAANFLRADATWDTAVQSVGLTDGSGTPIYAITGSPVTSSGTLTFSLKNQNANLIFAGPASGVPAAPGFRAIAGADFSSAITVTNNWTFAAAAGVSATFAGVAGSVAVTINGSSTSGQSQGLVINAGTTGADAPIQVKNQAASAVFFRIFGDGHGTLGPSATTGISWNTAGLATANNGLTVAASQVLTVAGNAAGTPYITVNNSPNTGAQTITIGLTNFPGTNAGAKTPTYIPVTLNGSKFWLQALPD